MPQTTPAKDEVQFEHQFLIADITEHEKRAGKATYLEAKNEFADNAYPLIRSIIEHFGERMSRVEDVVDELMNQTESYLQPGLAAQMTGTLNLGKVVADAVMRLHAGTIGEVEVKRLQQAAAAYLTAFEIAVEAIEEASVPEGEEEVADDEGGETDDATDGAP